MHRQFFDPAFYRIVVLDQRGAGRSTPLGRLEDNTTPKLIEDLERLRRHLGIDRWLVFGGSWGSTLAIACPELTPGAPWLMIFTDGRLLKRSSWSGPDE